MPMRNDSSSARSVFVGAFTLVEMLVVLTIVSMLLSLLVPAMSQAREVARRTLCLSNQRSIYLPTVAYATDFNNYLPPAPANDYQDILSGNGCPIETNANPGASDWSYPYKFWGEYVGATVTRSTLRPNAYWFPKPTGPQLCPSGARASFTLADQVNAIGWQYGTDYVICGMAQMEWSGAYNGPTYQALFKMERYWDPGLIKASNQLNRTFSYDAGCTNPAANANRPLWTPHQPQGTYTGMNVMYVNGSGTWIGDSQTAELPGGGYAGYLRYPLSTTSFIRANYNGSNTHLFGIESADSGFSWYSFPANPNWYGLVALIP